MVGRLPYRVGMDWQRLADVIRGELAKRGWTQKDLADRAEVDIKTISLLLNAHPRSRLPRSIPRVEAALGWAPGSARAVLEGDEPTSVEVPTSTHTPVTKTSARAAVEFWRAARQAQVSLTELIHSSLTLSDAGWHIPSDDVQDAVVAVRRYYQHADTITSILRSALGVLEHRAAETSDTPPIVDGEPLNDAELAIYKEMLDPYGETVAADAVRSLRRARQGTKRNDEEKQQVGQQRRAPDISQILDVSQLRSALLASNSDDDLDDASL